MERVTWSEEDKRRMRERSGRFLGVSILQRLVELRRLLVEENLKMLAWAPGEEGRPRGLSGRFLFGRLFAQAGRWQPACGRLRRLSLLLPVAGAVLWLDSELGLHCFFAGERAAGKKRLTSWVGVGDKVEGGRARRVCEGRAGRQRPSSPRWVWRGWSWTARVMGRLWTPLPNGLTDRLVKECLRQGGLVT